MGSLAQLNEIGHYDSLIARSCIYIKESYLNQYSGAE